MPAKAKAPAAAAPKADAKTTADPKAKADPKADTKVSTAKADPKVSAAKADSKADSKAKTDAKSKADAKAKTDADAKGKTEAKGNGKVAADAKGKTEAKGNSKSAADAKGKTDADAKTKVKAEKKTPKPKAEVESKGRRKVIEDSHILTSPARCASHLRDAFKVNKDSEVYKKIKELKDQLKAARTANPVDKELVEKLKKEFAEANRQTTRLSNECSIVTSVICDEALKDVVRFAMVIAAAQNKSMVDVEHLHAQRVEECMTYPLICNLPAWKDYSPEKEAELKAARAKINKEKRELKKAADEAAKAAGEEPAAKDAKDAEDGEDAEDKEAGEHHADKTTFTTYVDKALNAIRGETEYAKMRATVRIREYCSQLLSQLIAHISRMAEISASEIAKVRTIKYTHIVSVIKLILLNHGRTEEAIEPLLTNIANTLNVYQEALKAENSKKEEKMSEAKKAKIAADKAKKALESAKRSAELAAQRSEKTEREKEELAAKIEELERRQAEAAKTLAELGPSEEDAAAAADVPAEAAEAAEAAEVAEAAVAAEATEAPAAEADAT